MNAAELNRQIKEYADRLSPERLQVAADFLAYLADKESEEATQEILAIPGIMERRKPKKTLLRERLETGEKFETMYSVILEASAQEFYAKAEPALAQKLARCFAILEQTPTYHPNLKPLKGNLAGRYRYRVGD